MIEKARKNILVFVIPRQLLMYLSMSLMLLTLNVAYAQTYHSLSGVVISSTDNEPIPGVNVIIKGTTNGSITDLDGKYTIQVQEGDVVSVSFIGFLTKDVTITDQTLLDVSLDENVAEFEELVVIGYGVQKKKLNTGATVQVKGEEVKKMSTVSPFSALQGKTPGVNITQKSGKPGEGFKVTIRGIGTVGDASPLYIVDGVQTSIDNVNPSDIESIDVLKDAASAAIYGARGANGVIIVTTKNGGGEGVAHISFDSYYGIQELYNKVEFCDAQQFMAIQDIASLNSSGTRVDWEAKGVDRNSTDSGTDWIDEALNNNAVTQSHTLSMTGGTQNDSYAASLNYSSQDGIIGVGNGKSNYERLGFRLNSKHQIIEKKLWFGQHMNLMRTNTEGIETGGLYNNNLRGLYTTHPLLANKDENGEYVTTNAFNLEVGNPIASMDIKNQNKSQNNSVVGDVYFLIEPIKYLKVKTMFAIDYYSSAYRSYTPNYGYFTASDVVDYNKVSMNASHGTTWTFENTATYDRVFNDHKFTVMIGNSIQNYSGVYMAAEKQDCSFDDFDLAYLTSCATIVDATNVVGKAEDDVKTSSYFGRVSYNFQEKYMATATLRRDGSSKFGENSRWGTFPAVSAGWVMTNENFIESSKYLDFLKLRVSWGQNGNDKIDAFSYLASISSMFYYPLGTDDANRVVASVPGRGANPDLKWETSEQINVGVDARMIDAHLSLAFDLYQKKTKDWLVQAPILDIKGTTAPYVNGGDVTNTGVELALNWHDDIGQVSYYVGVNGAYNKNEVTAINNADGIIHGDANSLWQGISEIYRAEVGHPIGYFWGYETNGLFQSDAQVASYTSSDGTVIQPDAEPGDVIYIDRNDDGKLNDNDKSKIGNPHPDFTFGLNVSIEYKGFDLGLAASGVAGNQIAKGLVDFSRPATTNYPVEFYNNSWTTSNRDATLPRMLTGTEQNWKKFSTNYLEDGDYLRIQNVTLGYDFCKHFELPFAQLRFYVQAQNLATFTSYSGFDPEIGYAAQDWASGIDAGYYPHPRTYIVGLNVKF